MHYMDVVSLYPFVLKYCRYPLGHPRIYTENFKSITALHNPYFGVIKCTVKPPKKLLHPVLPCKCNGKLMFPLCQTCAEEKRQGFCDHSDEERTLTGEWISLELDKALEMGYEVGTVYEVWHWEKTEMYDGINQNTGLFTR